MTFTFLAFTALAFTVLGFLGIADVKVLASITLALLAVLAYSQIRSRRHVADIAKSQSHDPLSVLHQSFPPKLDERRATASSLLLIGVSLGTTVHGGSLAALRRMLESGGRLRVMVLDPTNDELVRAASRHRPAAMMPERLRRRIEATLDELEGLRDSTRGQLDIRVAPFVPQTNITAIDAARPAGMLVLQHSEHRALGESAPIVTLTPSDGQWYERLAAEAERLWEDGLSWPLDQAAVLGRTGRPNFKEEFGPELDLTMSRATELLITGVTRNTLIVSKYASLEDWIRRGCRVRVLLVEPRSSAISVAAERYYAERSPDSTRERVLHSLRLLTELKYATNGDLSVRLTSHPLSMGVISIDGNPAARSEASALFAEYYTYQARGEPKFILQPADGQWYENLRQEAEALWEGAHDHTLQREAPAVPDASKPT